MKNEIKSGHQYIGLAIALIVLVILVLLFGPEKFDGGQDTPSGRAVPLVQLPTDLIKEFTAKGVFGIAFLNDDAGVVQVLDFSDGAANVRSPEGLITGTDTKRGETPEPIVALPKELVKTLLTMDIPYMAYLSRSAEVLQVLELTDDGICVACLAADRKSPYQNQSAIPGQQRDGSLLDFAISAAEAACPRSCLSCSSGRCKNVLGNCCNCRQ